MNKFNDIYSGINIETIANNMIGYNVETTYSYSGYDKKDDVIQLSFAHRDSNKYQYIDIPYDEFILHIRAIKLKTLYE